MIDPRPLDGRPSHSGHCRRACLFALLLIGLNCSPRIARADDPPETTVLGTIEVTGSRLRRIEAESALPVQVIRREDIDRSGAQTVEQLLRQISANIGAPNLTTTGGGGSQSGFSGISLRALGARRTLVLLDGRRLAGYAFSGSTPSGTDINSIPLEAVERVEILKDGASAIYGSDAIGGVVNFILKKNFQGGTVSADHGVAEHGGSSETKNSVTLGFGNVNRDGFNVFVSVNYRKQSALDAAARDYAATGFRPDLSVYSVDSDAFPANDLFRGAYLNPSAAACPPPTVSALGGCFNDVAKQTQLLPSSESSHLLGRAVFRLTPHHDLYAEVLYSRDRVRSIAESSGADGSLIPSGMNIFFPTTSPFYPSNLGITGNLRDLMYLALPLGPRTFVNLAEQERVLLGAQGDVAGWAYDSALIYNESHARLRFASGFIDATAINNALEAGVINPFGDSGPAGDAILASTERRGEARTSSLITRGFDAHASRDLFNLPAGPVGVALGVEARRESIDDRIAPFVNDLSGFFYERSTSGARSVAAGYVELAVPIVKSLEAQIAAREDRYSDFGSTFNPKVGLRWQPLSMILARAAYGHGFRAPGLADLFNSPTTSNGFAQDPVRCPVTGQAADCMGHEVQFVNGGNPALKPERSEQASTGIVFQPNERFSASVDLWKIRISQTISTLSAATLLANDSAYEGTRIFRAAPDPAFPNLPGTLLSLVETNGNQGISRTQGVDLELAARSDATALGRLGFKMNGTYVQRFDRQFATAQFINGRAVYLNGIVVPRWQHYAALDWDAGPFKTTLNQTMQSGYQDAQLDPSGNARHVGVTQSWGLQVAYTGVKDATVTLGVDNLFDRHPETSDQFDYAQTAYNPTISDPRGRFWYGRLVLKF